GTLGTFGTTLSGPTLFWERRRIFLMPRTRYELDFKTSTYYRGGWPVSGDLCWFRPSSAPANDCDATRFYSAKDWIRTRNEVVNGFPSVRFDHKQGTESIWLAPSLGCAEVRSTRTLKTFLGFPIRAHTQNLIAFRFGEPDNSLFSPPPGIREG